MAKSRDAKPVINQHRAWQRRAGPRRSSPIRAELPMIGSSDRKRGTALILVAQIEDRGPVLARRAANNSLRYRLRPSVAAGPLARVFLAIDTFCRFRDTAIDADAFVSRCGGHGHV